MLNQKAERLRLKYKYRKLILTGRLDLPHEEAARLIGPDCAYHLYSRAKGRISSKSQPKQNKPGTKK